MNRRILKFVINPGASSVSMPRWSTPVHVAVEGDALYLWAMVNPDEPVENRTFQVVPTGASVDTDQWEYVATFLLEANSWLAAFAGEKLDCGSWHVFAGLAR